MNKIRMYEKALEKLKSMTVAEWKAFFDEAESKQRKMGPEYDAECKERERIAELTRSELTAWAEDAKDFMHNNDYVMPQKEKIELIHRYEKLRGE